MEKRTTKQLEAVKQYVLYSKEHPTAEEVCERVARDFPGTSLRTVYRNLNKLVEEGSLRKIEIPNAPDRFDSTLVPHHHIICRDCGRFEDVPFDEINGVPQLKTEDFGYKIENVEVIFRGLCPQCK